MIIEYFSAEISMDRFEKTIEIVKDLIEKVENSIEFVKDSMEAGKMGKKALTARIGDGDREDMG